ncbi:cytochrome c3 family protein [Mangrovibacterium lignilyticum]|uniref:cytochrome c3 family protein n=1 Tax=Mangrovibacterium lignilyticum TaxID=2668052 RepID=UPI0013D644F2|nr:cytochrome c3 family protein [Mangrovibacterium lignilyticum]
MRRLSLLILFLGSVLNAVSQSPHGSDFEIDCAVCHSPESWDLLQLDKTFDHSQTAFQLKGAHTAVDCKSCHRSLVFSAVETECVSCHLDMHNNTLGQDCSHCHNPQNWIITSVTQMHRQSRFPLTGAHTTADCFECHQSASNLQFETLGIDCFNCHQSDYLATTAPNHQEAGYSTYCVDCHSAQAVSWNAANFEHNFFPLRGGHAISCFECHTSGTFDKLSTDCISCHQAAYNATTDPDHLQVGFSTNCIECHQTTDQSWDAANFDHSTFPLTGGHAPVSCVECHSDGSGVKPSADCISCHQAEYNATTNPNHQQAGFSTLCTQCHTIDPGWEASDFKEHDSQYFPIYSGSHNGRWSSCIECHSNNSSYADFTCFSCHEHNQTETDGRHSEVSNYSYQSQACYSCHPTGRAEN